METSHKVLAIVAALALMVASAAVVEADEQCDRLVMKLEPCIQYLIYGGAVSSRCCSGIQALKRDGRTRDDRRVCCTCVERVASKFSYTSVQLDNAVKLSDKCGVSLSYEISPNVNCDTLE